jgi:tetratricopeptide (TPR) repeat protein
MRRFDRLEFDQKPEQELHSQGGQLIREEDHDQHYWIRKASDERRNGLHESAMRYYSRALELDKSLIGGWVGQVQMLIAMGEYPEADLWSRKALELFKNNCDLLAARGQALCRTGDLKNAAACCDAAIAQPGANAYPWIARGELILARKESIDAYCFDKATQIDPDWLHFLEIGSIYLHYGRTAKALTRIRTAVEMASDHAYCWYCQGACELALGMTASAEKSFIHCLQLAPNHLRARNSIDELRKHRKFFRSFLRRLFNRP